MHTCVCLNPLGVYMHIENQICMKKIRVSFGGYGSMNIYPAYIISDWWGKEWLYMSNVRLSGEQEMYYY